jgi:DNA-directed RNA polymerase subunit RPC12/RpoP
MARAETLTDRHEYLRGGLTGLACDRCGVRVLVKKNSPQHTSIQWTAESVQGCAEFAARVAAGERTALIATCTGLHASIERAAAAGRLEIPRELPREVPPT